MGLTLYVYYRVRPGCDAAALPAARALLAAVAADTGCHTHLARRRDDAGTWMEVYDEVIDAAALEAALARHLADSALPVCLAPDSRRHVEWFEAL